MIFAESAGNNDPAMQAKTSKNKRKTKSFGDPEIFITLSKKFLMT